MKGLCSVLVEFLRAQGGTLALDALLTVILLYPLFDHLIYGWSRKANEIDASLTPEAKKVYLEVFQKKTIAIDTVELEFLRLFKQWYGRHRFIGPIILVVIVASIVNFLLGAELIRLAGSPADFGTAPAAIAGAYTFVTWSFVSQVQRRSLSIADVMRGALRLAVAIPIGYAFGQLLNREISPFVAFAVGVFPLNTIGTMLRQLANRRLNLELGPAEAKSQISQLEGIDASTAERIEDADITTIHQLAWCDPIQLTMRTSLAFNYVVDIVGQALAWVYLGEKLRSLAPLGLRAGAEIRFFMHDLEASQGTKRAELDALMRAAAAASGTELAGLRNAFEQIAHDPYTEFIYEAWPDERSKA
jgi:hypothetical protein